MYVKTTQKQELNFEKCNLIPIFVLVIVIISKGVLREFAHLHPDAGDALNQWYSLIKMQDWETPNDLKQVFNNTDYVGNDRYVFNIRGNKYRLVAMIFFDIRTVFIRFIRTHAEYDRVDVSKI